MALTVAQNESHEAPYRSQGGPLRGPDDLPLASAGAGRGTARGDA
jgi:hypothetical protein